ncbi:unnamed protein product [Schistosoma mattheei]|uniref:Uncharacterized protein n=1 Tax=Schistosoma mattheei TaxID=31246 RepID=A0A183PH87_9TREM|nr:unnamed protein product [Schistosoma mattheei]
MHICQYEDSMVGGSRQETLDPGFVLLGTRQQSVPVILRELRLADGFDPVSPSFTAGLSGTLGCSYQSDVICHNSIGEQIM